MRKFRRLHLKKDVFFHLRTIYFLLRGMLFHKKRYYLPIEAEEVNTSSTYLLEINNCTSGPLLFKDIYDETTNKIVPEGENIIIQLKLKSIKIGDIMTTEVVSAPYIDSGLLGPDKAYINYIDFRGVNRKFVIDLKNESLFKEYYTDNHDAVRKIIKVKLSDDNLDKLKWFTKNDYKT